MSYQVLARKWRPSNFSQVAGQSHVLKSLINALDNERLHHAYLFTGTRGVGKTTLARILAKCLNCEKGVGSTPCEQCDSCLEINQGRFLDLIEVDAASRTKVEDTRELLENVQYTPTRGRYKVYLIDEVHMLSNHSFNALLKTLEEPPPHVKFLFATTDPQKLPVTILSRCLQFNLKNLSPELIVNYLDNVLRQEEVTADEEALWQIAAVAAGSMRDALTLVDQAIAYCQGEIRAEGVIEMLGIPEQRQVFDLLAAMAQRDAELALQLLEVMAEQNPDYAHTLDTLLSVLHRIALAQVVPKAVDNSFGDRGQVLDLAAQFSAEDVQLYYQIGAKGREELKLATELRTAFEMLLLRMLIFSPDYAIPERESSPQEVKAAPRNDSGSEKKNARIPGAVKDEAGSRKNSVNESDKSPKLAVGEGAEDSAPATIPLQNQQQWRTLLPDLKVQGVVYNILANSELRGVTGNKLELLLDEEQSAVYSDDYLPRINAALTAYYGSDIVTRIEIGAVQQDTAARAGIQQRLKEREQLVSEFEHDAVVQDLLRRFSGRLEKDSISVSDDEK